jgi:REP element-mobilizing transposase RayT
MTWHTKGSYPFVTERIEKDLYAFIRNRVIQDKNAYFHSVGGMPDHIHLAASLFPPFEIDTWIGQIKGASSHEFGKSLQWQSGYGEVSFGNRDLKWVVSYIENQKERHRKGLIEDRLERILPGEQPFVF